MAQLRAEKCELEEAELAYSKALELGKTAQDLRGQMEAVAGLLRIAGEAKDLGKTQALDAELDALIIAHPQQVPPMVWHCKGTVAYYQQNYSGAQRCWNRYLKAVKEAAARKLDFGSMSLEECLLKGWISLLMMWRHTKPLRSVVVSKSLLRKFENRNYKGVNGFLYLLMGWSAEEQADFEEAMRWYQKAHASFLSEHNWYYHLYVLLRYARVCRIQQNYPQAYWYLDLLDKATSSSSYFGQLRQAVADERSNLEQDAVDLLVDSRKGIIKTRESSSISFGKQYVLLHILEALSAAHGRIGDDTERGLSKSEIIERVWDEPYRPEAHDNKLYYNINRLRKLIEPDVKNPQYLLNWKEGYRLAPGLRIQFVGLRGSGTVGFGGSKQGGAV
ncbi:MAG: hypothetical protein A2070_12770 [Bdellovibrionales bacterium GWC1_52_8]|nr:MAG: hypothetical protein A2070_12770 [Bdellovibrionales bacterium GWC1_52_8]